MLKRWLAQSSVLPGAPGVTRVPATHDTGGRCAQDIAASGGQLLALWAERQAGAAVLAAFLCDERVLVAELPLPDHDSTYPGLPTSSRAPLACSARRRT